MQCAAVRTTLASTREPKVKDKSILYQKSILLTWKLSPPQMNTFPSPFVSSTATIQGNSPGSVLAEVVILELNLDPICTSKLTWFQYNIIMVVPSIWSRNRVSSTTSFQISHLSVWKYTTYLTWTPMSGVYQPLSLVHNIFSLYEVNYFVKWKLCIFTKQFFGATQVQLVKDVGPVMTPTKKIISLHNILSDQ